LRPVELSIANIIVDPAYYPRRTTSQQRIEEFMEAMDCGEVFPPVKAAKDPDSGKYVLLDGRHRLEAARLRGQTKIRADVLPVAKDYWLLASVRFNGKTSLPLSSSEIKQAIICAWNSGIKDTHIIAKEIGRSISYVQKVLKPLRDNEKFTRDQEIFLLSQRGLSQAEIAKKVGLSKGRVCQIKSRADTITQDKPNRLANGIIPFTKRSAKTNQKRYLDVNPRSTGTQNPHSQADPYPSYIDQVLVPDASMDARHVVRTMELVKHYGLDLIDVAHTIDRPIAWVKKIIMTAIVLAIRPTRDPNDAFPIGASFGLKADLSLTIRQAIVFKTMFCPIGPDMDKWVKENIPLSDLRQIGELLKVSVNDLYYLVCGKQPPSPPKETFNKLPPGIKSDLKDHRAALQYIRNQALKGMFSPRALTELLAEINRIREIINEIYDAVAAIRGEQNGIS